MNIIEANDIRPGDKVQLAPWKLFEEITRKQYSRDSDEYREDSKYSFKNCGYVWKYVHLNSLGVHLESVVGMVDRSISVPEEAILGHAFEFGQRIYVKNEGIAWIPADFTCYIPGNGHFTVLVHNIGLPEFGQKKKEYFSVSAFQYSKPIRKELREVTLHWSQTKLVGLTNKNIFGHYGPHSMTKEQYDAVVEYMKQILDSERIKL